MAKSLQDITKNMVTELGLKTTLETTGYEINKVLFDLGREYVQKNVTPLCISLCELITDKTDIKETFLSWDSVTLKEVRGRVHMIEFVSKLGLDVHVYNSDTNEQSLFTYNLDWDSDVLQSKPNVLYELFDVLVDIYEQNYEDFKTRLNLKRFRLEENIRKVIKSVLNENKMSSRIINSIDNIGLFETLKVTGLSFDDLSGMVKKSVFTRKIKIDFIKEFSDSLPDGYDMSTEDTIIYDELSDSDDEAFIAYVQKEGITVDVYGREYLDYVDSTLIGFNEVDNFYIDTIFDYLTDYYDKTLDKNES